MWKDNHDEDDHGDRRAGRRSGNPWPYCKTGLFSQENESLDPSQRVIDYIRDTAEYVKTEGWHGVGLCDAGAILFDATLQYSLIGKLSGGEKRRLYLLKVLMEAPNILILDEPTNDLDIQTLAILEDYLRNFRVF